MRAGGPLSLDDIGLGLVVRQGELLDQGVGPVGHAALDVAGAELGQHLFLQDHAGQGVGEHRLQAVADLDAHLVFAGRHDEQGAVVLALLADAPGAAELIAVVLDRIALQRRQGDDHQLPAGLGLQVREPGGEVLLDLGRQDMGVVHHPAGQGREARRRLRPAGQGGQQRRREGDAAEDADWPHRAGAGAGAAGADDPPRLKLTVGAAWAPSEAANSCMGLDAE